MEKGQKYNRLTAVRFVKRNNYHKQVWLFRCNCGVEKEMVADNVIRGISKSCGCYNREVAAIHAKKMGSMMSTHKLYVGVPTNPSGFALVYRCMIQRCKDKCNTNYKNYGGRGIKCLWSSYDSFRKDMETSYKQHINKYGKDDTQLDRIDNNGNYCKENCKWVTKKENARNRRTNTFINGITMAEFSEINKIKYANIITRKRLGWDTDEIKNNKHYAKIGERHSHETNNLEFKKYIMNKFKKSSDIVKLFFGVLDEREKTVLENRLGLKDQKRRTLDDIGKELNLTRERVRQIEYKALEKLKTLDKDLTA
jgi:hypothetical protein